MLYQVPQFIEVEDKILGPLTMKQLFVVAGLGFLMFALYFIFATWLFVIIAVISAMITAALLFGKIQGRPILAVVGSIISYYLNPRLYLWKREGRAMRGDAGKIREPGRLQDISATLDIGKSEE